MRVRVEASSHAEAIRQVSKAGIRLNKATSVVQPTTPQKTRKSPDHVSYTGGMGRNNFEKEPDEGVPGYDVDSDAASESHFEGDSNRDGAASPSSNGRLARWFIPTTSVAVIAIIAIGFLYPFSDSDQSRSDSVDSRINETGDATLRAWNDMVKIDSELLRTYRFYNAEYASAILRSYETINLVETDVDFRLRIGDLLDAASNLVELQLQLDREISFVQNKRDGKAMEKAMIRGEQAASDSDSILGALFKGAVGGVVGTAESNLLSELEINRIRDRYSPKISAAAKRFQTRKERVKLLQKTLFSRYGWIESTSTVPQKSNSESFIFKGFDFK